MAGDFMHGEAFFFDKLRYRLMGAFAEVSRLGEGDKIVYFVRFVFHKKVLVFIQALYYIIKEWINYPCTPLKSPAGGLVVVPPAGEP
jgi:hypothetical protein